MYVCVYLRQGYRRSVRFDADACPRSINSLGSPDESMASDYMLSFYDPTIQLALSKSA